MNTPSPGQARSATPPLLVLGGVLICALMFLKIHFQLILVVGESMSPTFSTGDLLLVDKRAYRDSNPQRGDIVVVRYRNELIVKRIVGLPGEEVEVKMGSLYIDKTRVPENHPLSHGSLNIGGGKLSQESFAVLGDNRSLPPAQIVHAIVSKDTIVGRAAFALRLGRPDRHIPTDREAPSVTVAAISLPALAGGANFPHSK